MDPRLLEDERIRKILENERVKKLIRKFESYLEDSELFWRVASDPTVNYKLFYVMSVLRLSPPPPPSQASGRAGTAYP